MTAQTMRPFGSEPLPGPALAFGVELDARSGLGHAPGAAPRTAFTGASS